MIAAQVPPRSGSLRSARRSVALVVALALVGALLGSVPPHARAQEATPAGGSDAAATPFTLSATCALPLPADAPTSDGTGGPQALASPVASPVASGQPNAALTGTLTATAGALAACLSEGDIETTILLTSDVSRGQLVSGGLPLTPSEYGALVPTLPSVRYRIVSVEEVARIDENRATATVTYVVANQLLVGSWQFVVEPVENEPRWVLGAIEPRPVDIPTDAATIEVETRPGEYRLSVDQVPGPTVALAITNDDEQEHEVLVLTVEGDADVNALLTQPGPALPEGLTYVGDLIVPAGEQGTLLLIDLAPGTYTIVDLLPDAQGVPHFVAGEVATFTVT